MAASFIFGGDTGETPESLESKRAIAQALAMRGMSRTPKNVGEGLAAVGNALAYAMASRNFDQANSAAHADLAKTMAGLLNGGTAATPAVPTSPSTPSIPPAALSGADMSSTPQTLSGGTLPQNGASLTDAVAKLESSNSPVNGPAGGYANYRFQQFPAFVKQYGSGEDGVLNYARQVLAANPNATFGDMYGGYVTGTGNPATARAASLQTTTQPGAQGAYANLVRNSPIDPNTPLSQLVTSQVASTDPNFAPSPGGMDPRLSALLSPNMTVNGPAPAQPNVTMAQVKPTTLPIGSPAAPAQAPAQGAGAVPAQIGQTITALMNNPLPQAQQMGLALMQRYLAPPQYDLMPQADGTVMAVNKLNPRDHYVAFKGTAKPITVAPGATLVTPGATGAAAGSAGPASANGGFQTVYQNTTGLFDKPTLTAMADQYLSGDKSVLQNLGRTAIGGMNMSALRERIVSRANELGIKPTEVASRIGQFDSYVAAQKATGTRGGNVTMAATEAANLGGLVLDTSAAVPRSNYPVWNRVTNAYAENTGDPNIVKFTGALNSYVNAYARAINPSGSTTVSDKEHAREILDTAMSHGQIQAGIDQLQKELEQAKRAPASASETIKQEFQTRANPRNSEVLQQARDAIARGAPRDAVIQRLKQNGIDASGL